MRVRVRVRAIELGLRTSVSARVRGFQRARNIGSYLLLHVSSRLTELDLGGTGDTLGQARGGKHLGRAGVNRWVVVGVVRLWELRATRGLESRGSSRCWGHKAIDE